MDGNQSETHGAEASDLVQRCLLLLFAERTAADAWFWRSCMLCLVLRVVSTLAQTG